MEKVYLSYNPAGYSVREGSGKVSIPKIRHAGTGLEERTNLPETINYLNSRYSGKNVNVVLDTAIGHRDFKVIGNFIKEKLPRAKISRGKY